MLTGWLERLTPERLMDEGVACWGAEGEVSLPKREVPGAVSVKDGAPVVLTLQVK